MSVMLGGIFIISNVVFTEKVGNADGWEDGLPVGWADGLIEGCVEGFDVGCLLG